MTYSKVDGMPFLINLKSARSTYYGALCRILFVEDGADLDNEFEAFMRPFEKKLGELNSITTVDAFRSENVKVNHVWDRSHFTF